jgi:hypothetical protein
MTGLLAATLRESDMTDDLGITAPVWHLVTMFHYGNHQSAKSLTFACNAVQSQELVWAADGCMNYGS